MSLRRVWVHGIFNAKKCAAYLRSIGVELLPEQVRGWLNQERTYRAERRRKRFTEAYRCGDCSKRWERTFARHNKKARACPHCGGRAVEMWLLEMVRGDGTVEDYRAHAAEFGYDGPWGHDE